MKKKFLVLTVFLVIALLATALFACAGDVDENGSMTLVVKDEDNIEEYTVDLSKLSTDDSKTGLMKVLDYLQEQGKITYTAQNGEYLTQVNSIKEGNGIYLYLYTDVEDDFDTSEYQTTLDYKDKTLTNSGVGASLMNIKDGCTILITTITF